MSELSVNILQPSEIELYVEYLEPSSLEELGHPKWFEKHHRIQKLSLQSAIQAGEMREESVKETMISLGKIPVILHEAICIQVWREKIFKQLLKMEKDPKNSFIGEIILYHEATAVSFLQNILFHREAALCLEDALLDLVDYCVCEVVRLLAHGPNIQPRVDTEDVTNWEALANQSKCIGLNIGLSSVCILSYLTGFLDEVSLSVVNRMYVTHDVPLLMSHVIETSPWKKKDVKKNIIQVFKDGIWKDEDKIQGMTQHEGQCWVALRNLLLDPKFSSHYDLNNFRKQQLLKVRKYLHETIIDQIYPLIELKQFLAQLSFTNPPTCLKKSLIMEAIPEIKNKILAQGEKKWKKIAQKHAAAIFDDEGQLVEVAKRFEQTYNFDDLEKLRPGGPICAVCGDPAAKKCSKCKSEWYCGRECQVKMWPKHKTDCNMLESYH